MRHHIQHILIAICAFLVLSCKNTSGRDDQLFEFLTEGFESSNISLHNSSSSMEKELEEKTLKPETFDRASEWFPILKKIEHLITTLYGDVDSLKIAAHYRFPLTKDEILELYSNLQKSKNELLLVHPTIFENFKDNMIFTTRPFDSSDNGLGFYHTFFKGASKAEVLVVLSKIQNNLRVYQNRLFNYCNLRVAAIDDGFYSYAAIVSQNTHYTRPGQEVKILAGVGAFSKSTKPQIKIGGILLQLTDEGYVEYKIKAQGPSGKKYIPVEIAHFNPITGKMDTIKQDVEYTVDDKN